MMIKLTGDEWGGGGVGATGHVNNRHRIFCRSNKLVDFKFLDDFGNIL